jgi:hypothetical protein
MAVADQSGHFRSTAKKKKVLILEIKSKPHLMNVFGLIFLGLAGVAVLIDVTLILFAGYHWIEKYLP